MMQRQRTLWLRKGMTLMEVMVALVVLTAIMASLGVFAARFTSASSIAMNRATAVELASHRLERVKGVATYVAVDSLQTTEANAQGYKGFTRQTVVRRVGGQTASDTIDFKVVTVSVTAPGIKSPIAKTTTIAQF